MTGFLIVGGVRESYPAAFDDWEAEGVIRGFHTECDLDGLVADHCPQDFLLMSEPVLLPPDAAAPARRYIMADSRVCSVSSWSNAAGALSFPFRSTPNPYPIPGKTEFEVTQALRTDTNSEPVPISLPWGAVNLINSSCMDVLGGLRIRPGSPGGSVLDGFGTEAARRGFRSVLDPSTYVHYSADLCVWPPVDRDGDVDVALGRAGSLTAALAQSDCDPGETPLTNSFFACRARVRGMRLVIDGSCFGDYETGTQVQAMALIGALARHPEVASVGVGIPNAQLPRYAEGLLGMAGVDVRWTPSSDVSAFDSADIIHVPFQPGPIPWATWWDKSRRVVVTIQDLIAYDNGSYHFDATAWNDYRGHIRTVTERSDLVVAISEDVGTSIRTARLDVPEERLCVVDQGTDHLTGHEPAREPEALRRRGLTGAPFILVIGASYQHKNRDLAMRAWRSLRSLGYPHQLLVAGVTVGKGSGFIEEERERWNPAGAPVLLPDVDSAERNWLLKHATLVLYPSSAEGFGLVPFEAARFGTPTVHVEFGPLKDLLGGSPAAVQGWSEVSLVQAMCAMLDDPQVARDSVRLTLDRAESLTWTRTASLLVEEYMRIMGLPTRRRA